MISRKDPKDIQKILKMAFSNKDKFLNKDKLTMKFTKLFGQLHKDACLKRKRRLLLNYYTWTTEYKRQIYQKITKECPKYKLVKAQIANLYDKERTLFANWRDIHAKIEHMESDLEMLDSSHDDDGDDDYFAIRELSKKQLEQYELELENVLQLRNENSVALRCLYRKKHDMIDKYAPEKMIHKEKSHHETCAPDGDTDGDDTIDDTNDDTDG
jgi:hypothetical protein